MKSMAIDDFRDGRARIERLLFVGGDADVPTEERQPIHHSRLVFEDHQRHHVARWGKIALGIPLCLDGGMASALFGSV
jgi:hypothetical protein